MPRGHQGDPLSGDSPACPAPRRRVPRVPHYYGKFLPAARSQVAWAGRPEGRGAPPSPGECLIHRPSSSNLNIIGAEGIGRLPVRRGVLLSRPDPRGSVLGRGRKPRTFHGHAPPPSADTLDRATPGDAKDVPLGAHEPGKPPILPFLSVNQALSCLHNPRFGPVSRVPGRLPAPGCNELERGRQSPL